MEAHSENEEELLKFSEIRWYNLQELLL